MSLPQNQREMRTAPDASVFYCFTVLLLCCFKVLLFHCFMVLLLYRCSVSLWGRFFRNIVIVTKAV
jgi:hypothetical protein